MNESVVTSWNMTRDGDEIKGNEASYVRSEDE
jgi:hypothetical protein